MAKLIIAGGRDIEWIDIDWVVKNAIEKLPINSIYEIEEVVSGGAKGVDRLGETWAHEKQLKITWFHADWNKYGPAAGPKRNKQMAEYVGKEGFLIAIWDGKSKGTKNMIREAKLLGIPTYIERV